MKIGEYKQIDTKILQEKVIIPAQYDADSNVISEERTEIIQKEVPVMGMVYRDATPEELEEFERQKAEMPEPEPTPEERLDVLETTTDDMILLMAELIGGN